MFRRLVSTFALLVAAGLSASAAAATDPALVAAATREGRVVVYSVLSTKAAQPLIRDFEALYPGVTVDYDGEKGSNEMDARFRAESAAGAPTADVVWSSSTDMQMQLVADGFAATYRSPEASGLPGWAVFQDQAFGTTLEPVVFVYNKDALRADQVPQDHRALVRTLGAAPARLRGRVTGFDVTRSGVGLMFLMQDHARLGSLDPLLAGFGKSGFVASPGTGDMLTGINAGRFVLGYNIMGAYALSRSGKDLPRLGIVYPRDYTLLLTRVAFVNRRAAHPNAARLWLDYLLSARGQKLLGDSIELYPIREGVEARLTASGLLARLGPAAAPIRPDMDLVGDRAAAERQQLLTAWRAALDGAATEGAR